MRREEADGVVAPVVAQAFFLQEAVVDELVDRHKFDGGDAELPQIFDDRWICEARVGSTDVRRHVQVEIGHATHMGFVDYRIMVGDVRMLVVAPVEIRIDHGRFHGMRRGIQRIHAGDVLRAFEPIRIEAFVTVDVSLDGFGVRVEQQLVRVAPQALCWIIRTVHTIAVPLPGLYSRQIVMPYVGVLLRHFHSGLTVFLIEKTKLDFLGHLREEGEIHAGAVVARTEWIHRSRSDLHNSSIARFAS